MRNGKLLTEHRASEKGMRMEDGVRTAYDRLVQTVRSGDWEQVPRQAEAYGGAVRADERKRVVADATEAVERVFGPAEDLDERLVSLRARCLAALQELS